MAQNSKNNKNKQNKQFNKKYGSDKNSVQKKRQMSNQKKKSNSYCRWLLGSIFLIGLITAALVYDTEVNGKSTFAKSATGNMLRKIGMLNHVENAWYTTMGAAARAYKFVEMHLPTFAKPYIQMTMSVLKIVRNTFINIFINIKDMISANLPVAADFMEKYVPGLPDKIGKSATYLWDIQLNTYNIVTGFFKTQVLVGNFSPEKLSEAFNHTQNLALEFYKQFHKKVDAYAKLK